MAVYYFSFSRPIDMCSSFNRYNIRDTVQFLSVCTVRWTSFSQIEDNGNGTFNSCKKLQLNWENALERKINMAKGNVVKGNAEHRLCHKNYGIERWEYPLGLNKWHPLSEGSLNDRYVFFSLNQSSVCWNAFEPDNW